MNNRATEEPLTRRSQLESRINRLHRMIEIRTLENRIQSLYNDGEIRGSTHLCNGQEAIAVGIAASLRIYDKVMCTYRGHGHALALGISATQIFAELCGRVIGCAGGVGGSMHLVGEDVGLFPTFAIVGAGLPIACGAALATQIKGNDDVSVAIFGDGATNTGAFHESLNFAAIRKLPVVFVCENNLYGEYSRIETTTPIIDLASRGDAYSIPSSIIDGQDVDAVKDAVTSAVLLARVGNGPSLLEMKTYRYSGHSRSDQATYRPSGELDSWLKRDPIDILAKRLEDEGALSGSEMNAIKEQIATHIETSVAEALDAPEPDISELLKHVTAE